MRKIIFGVLGLLALQAPAFAATAPAATCSSALDAVTAEWRAASFSSPAKPAQARVPGLAGYETSGPGHQQISQAIRHAAAACRAGDQSAARQWTETAQSLLQHDRGGI